MTREQMWAKQQIRRADVDYKTWEEQKQILQRLSVFNHSCIFAVDVLKGRYDFASASFADIFGYNSSLLKSIAGQGDYLEERIHPDDRTQLIDLQIRHSRFIYAQPLEARNNYSSVYRFRMLNSKKQYIYINSRQQVFLQDRRNKAWIITGVMEVAPDQQSSGKVIHTVYNRLTGEIVPPLLQSGSVICLTERETEILRLIRQGYRSKEIAFLLGVSIFTIHNHRKNILFKLGADNAIEAINYAKNHGLID